MSPGWEIMLDSNLSTGHHDRGALKWYKDCLKKKKKKYLDACHIDHHWESILRTMMTGISWSTILSPPLKKPTRSPLKTKGVEKWHPFHFLPKLNRYFLKQFSYKLIFHFFLDVTLDLSNNSYKPFIKPNQNPSYINVNSNHPKNIIKQIPKAVNLRIGKLSANEKIFKESSKRYIEALKNSGFKEDFRYLKQNITTEFTKENNNYVQKNRKRKIIWFNPPFCKLANIDVGKYFLRLIDKHFKQDNILHKIFNRKTLKISYSCTNNISQIINSHNNKLINKFHNQVNNNNINSKKIECNCKSQSDCPMNGLCSLDNVVYQAIIYPKEDISDKKYYIGVSSTNFKIRYGNHKYSFSHEHQKNQTALSKHYWGLKNKGLTPDIQWSILKRSSTPKSFDSRCNLCLEEKIHIWLFPEPKILLNKRNELIARCRHRAKFKL